MVANMANFGDSKEVEDGNGEIPASDLKGSLADTGTSSSENTDSSSDEVSEAEEEEEEKEEKEGDSDEGVNQGACPDPRNDVKNGEDKQPLCTKCEALQRPIHQIVRPKEICENRWQLMLEDEGVYECSETGLVFEVSQGVRIRYRILSWSKFSAYLCDSWKFAGPIFDVDCDPAILKSIQFPHSLCLAGPDKEVKFSVLHVKNNKGLIEPSVDHSRSHIKWNVSSLSPVGPIAQTDKPAEHHGVVLVYREVGQLNSYSFRVYLATNNDSDIADVRKEVRSSKKRYVKIEKPPQCQRLLEENKKYRLTSEPQGDITPEDIQFTLAVVKIKGYFEAFFEQPPTFKLSLIETESEQVVWSTIIREGDCVVDVENTRMRSLSRKRSCSQSSEDPFPKKARSFDESDGVRTSHGVDLTDKQLMQLAKCMGKEWKQIAIAYLDLSKQDVEEIEASEEDLAMKKFQMLDRWRRRQCKGEAGAVQLFEILNQIDVPNEVISKLREMLRSDSPN